MKKNTMRAGLILLITMAVFNVVVFVLPHKFNATFWTGYAFTMAAFLLQILFAFIAFGKSDNLKKVFMGFSIAQLGTTYLFLQLIWGLVCIFVPGIAVTIAVVVSVILLGLYLVFIIAAVSGREMVNATEEKVAAKTFYIKSIQTDIDLLIEKTDDALLKKNLKDLADTVKYSDPMSNEALFGIELKIEAKTAELSYAVESGDSENAYTLIRELQLLFSERNKKSKLYR